MPRKQIVIAPLFVRIPFESKEEKAAFDKAVEQADGKTTGRFLLELIRKELEKNKKKVP